MSSVFVVHASTYAHSFAAARSLQSTPCPQPADALHACMLAVRLLCVACEGASLLHGLGLGAKLRIVVAAGGAEGLLWVAELVGALGAGVAAVAGLARHLAAWEHAPAAQPAGTGRRPCV